MELLSPAGNAEKLYYAYAYGADAAYIGLKSFSLRVKADNFYGGEHEAVRALKRKFPGRKLYCALNILFHNGDIDHFVSEIDYFKEYPIDAFIVQDLGVVPILQAHFPNAALHLSTQASCINREAVKMYRSMGFQRIVLGREISLNEIREIKDFVPDMELEAFCHGAMCIAYAGRCLMSAYLTGRSAQSGACTHTCRWDFDVLAKPWAAKEIAESGTLALREKKRPDDLLPIYEGEDFTAVLSSKDLRMVEHLDDMKRAGLDSIKIEGRMKSAYYVALVTRAYRKALDALDGKIPKEDAAPFIAELEKVGHRASGTGFYYGRSDADKAASGASESSFILAAEIGRRLSPEQEEAVFSAGAARELSDAAALSALHPKARAARAEIMAHSAARRKGFAMYALVPRNMLRRGDAIEFVSPNVAFESAPQDSWTLINPEDGTELGWVCDGHPCVFYTSFPLLQGTLVRMKAAAAEI